MTAKKKASNPGVPVIAMNPAEPAKGAKKVARKKKRKTTHARKPRARNPGNPSRGRVTHRRRRRRSNPAQSIGATLLNIGLTVVGAVVGVGIGWGLRQTNLEPKTAAAIQAAGSLLGGGALAAFVSPEVGGGLAATGSVLGVASLLEIPGATMRARSTSSPKKLRMHMAQRTLNGLDDDGLDALGVVTAALDGLDDEEEDEGLGAVQAELEGAGEDEEEDEGLGAIQAELEGAGEEEDDGGELEGAGEEEDDYLG